jgi:acyl-coenzyme A thioesterase PaaI-like protein
MTHAPSDPILAPVPGAPASRDASGPSLQERYAPTSRCFGCGPANPAGLHIRSRLADDGLVATWQPSPEHEAFEGVLNGGIIGTLLDCHSNWTAAMHMMAARGADRPPACVTADYSIHLLRPTPTDGPVTLRPHVVESGEDRATVEATLEARGQVAATCRGTFVAVGPGHPAYGRW